MVRIEKANRLGAVDTMIKDMMFLMDKITELRRHVDILHNQVLDGAEKEYLLEKKLKEIQENDPTTEPSQLPGAHPRN